MPGPPIASDAPSPDGPPWDRGADGSFLFWIQAQPGARRVGVGGAHGDAVRVRVAEPADRGRANAAVVVAVAGALGVPRAEVSLVAGATARRKRIRVARVPSGSRGAPDAAEWERAVGMALAALFAR